MAPDLALELLAEIPRGHLVVDPMCGSGTVIRAASDLGLNALGTDVDPLAALMATVWTRPVSPDAIRASAARTIQRAVELESVRLPWIDQDPDTIDFINYWFAREQQEDLRRLVAATSHESGLTRDALRLAISRTIITKDHGASLARDVSHSRPHRVRIQNDYDVMRGFRLAADRIAGALEMSPPQRRAIVVRADSRTIPVADGAAAAVVTSPPYLNAIDYLRGHRLSLVWLGHRIGELRTLRSESIGAERGSKIPFDLSAFLPEASQLPNAIHGWVTRFALDIEGAMKEIHRILAPAGRAVFVLGNSRLRGVEIDNAGLIERVAWHAGLKMTSRFDRPIPARNRYLPPPLEMGRTLDARMKTESVMTFRQAGQRERLKRVGQP